MTPYYLFIRDSLSDYDDWQPSDFQISSYSIDVLLNYLKHYPDKRSFYSIWDLSKKEEVKSGYLSEFCEHASTYRIEPVTMRQGYILSGHFAAPGLYCNECGNRIRD